MIQADQQRSVSEICNRHDNRPDCLIEILHGVQDSAGFVSDEDLKTIAEALNLSRADVHGVVSFYHDFRRTAPGKTVVKICLAEACQAVGCNALKDHAETALSTEVGSTSSSGDVTLEPVYCLGNCALGPAMMIDGALHGRVTPEKFDSLVQTESSVSGSGS